MKRQRFAPLILLALIPFTLVATAQEPAQQVETLETRLADLAAQEEAVRAELREWKAKQRRRDERSTDPHDPQFHLPRLPEAPVIDGVMEDGEWDRAIAVTTGSGIRGAGLRERPSAIFYLGWDSDHVYVAQRLPLRDGEKLKRLNREPRHDNVQPHETAWEFYIDRGSFGSHPSLCRWQFMANAAGNKWDYENQVQIGQKYYDWDAEWEMKQRLTPDGRFWEVEAAIPRTSVYQEEPIADGQVWKIGFATDLHNPWTWSGFYGWNVPATFADATPVIRMFRPEHSLVVRGIGFDMELENTTGERFQAEVVATVRAKERKGGFTDVVRKSWPVDLKPGETRRLNVSEPLGSAVEDQTPYNLHIMVLRDGESIYTWTRHFQYNAPDNKIGLAFEPDPYPFVAEVGYAPLSDFLRLTVDKYDYERAEEVASAVAEVRREGGTDTVARTELTAFAYGKASRVLDVPRLEPGAYTCAFRLLDAQGAQLAERVEAFDVQDLAAYPWIGNDLGKDDLLPAPFSPLAPEGATLKAFKKELVMDGSGLPASIRVEGDELLAGPIRLEGEHGGRAFTSKAAGSAPHTGAASETRAGFTGSMTAGPLQARTDALWEYDSTGRIRLTLEPPEGGADLASLRLVIPFTPEASLNFMTVALHMRRTCRAGRIPAGPGVVWTSQEVPGQKMAAGSFVPIVWVGNRSMGMTWFADSDQGWWPNDEHPSIELVRREDGGADLVLNLASAPVTLDGPRTLEFGLNVNPVRPMSEHQRSPVTFGYLKEQGRWVPGASPRREFALRYPQDPETSRKLADALHRYGQIYAPYTETSAQDIPHDTVQYFKEEMTGPSFGLTPNDISNDCTLYWSWRWFKDCGGDGYYFDNVFPRLAYNPRNSTAYELPDGRVQPGYCMWAYRDHFKRLRVLLHQMRPRYRVCIHNTRFQFAPVMAFADLAMGGEMATPHMGSPDFMTMYPRDFMEVMYNPYLWGYKLSHLYKFKYRTYVDADGEFERDAAMKVHRSAMGTMLAHGMEFFNVIDYDPSLMTRYRLVKSLCGGSMEFIPGWEAAGRFSLREDNAQAAAAVWQGDKALVIVLTNFTDSDRHLHLDVDFPALIGMPGKDEERIVTDLEDFNPARGSITMLDNEIPGHEFPRMVTLETQSMVPNTLRVQVPARNLRLILVANLALAKGAGF